MWSMERLLNSNTARCFQTQGLDEQRRRAVTAQFFSRVSTSPDLGYSAEPMARPLLATCSKEAEVNIDMSQAGLFIIRNYALRAKARRVSMMYAKSVHVQLQQPRT